jgi:hypothetical protein
MMPDQELAELCDAWPEWRIWRGRGHHGQPDSWHATLQTTARSVILASNGPAELRQRLEQAAGKNTAGTAHV